MDQFNTSNQNTGLDTELLKKLQNQENPQKDQSQSQHVASFLDDNNHLREHINKRRELARLLEIKKNQVVFALKSEGFTEKEINDVFTNELTPELEKELIQIAISKGWQDDNNVVFCAVTENSTENSTENLNLQSCLKFLENPTEVAFQVKKLDKSQRDAAINNLFSMMSKDYIKKFILELIKN